MGLPAGESGQPDVVPGEVVHLRGVAARVNGARLWSGLDLSVWTGGFVAVIGPNGAGEPILVLRAQVFTGDALFAAGILGGRRVRVGGGAI